jgi:hypothetical protein
VSTTDVRGWYRNLLGEELHNFYSLPDITVIKSACNFLMNVT